MGSDTEVNYYNDYHVDQSTDLREGKDRQEEAPFTELTEEERRRLFGIDAGNVGTLTLPKYGGGSGANTP
tara:strand:+ start:5289 stop:5498 length:210 start_codon:yes stop_codon:yes gene_type:complete